jgi:hypothetical protein
MNPSISTFTAVCVLAATAQVAPAASAPEAARDSTVNPDAEYKERANAADAERRRELYEGVLRARISD